MLKPDCVLCTQAKQHIESIPKSMSRKTEPGELTHIDLWEKYIIYSINSNQYYLLFIDDAKQYITVKFLKEKSAAAQGVINYLANLITQGQNLKAIQIDSRKEFMNQKLESWCKEQGIETGGLVGFILNIFFHPLRILVYHPCRSLSILCLSYHQISCSSLFERLIVSCTI